MHFSPRRLCSHSFFYLVVVAPLSVCAPDTAHAESSIVIEDCAVFDSEAATMLPERTIVIQGDRIVAVTAASEAVDAPQDATRINGLGKYVIPGLIDAHVHLMHILDFANVSSDEVLPLYLAAGVTSLRSTGDDIVVGTLAARFAGRHPESCPRIFTCSPILDKDPPMHRDVGRGVTDPAQVPAILDDMQRWNATTVKLYVGIARPLGRTIIEEAHRRNLRVTGHLGGYSAQQAVEDGIDCIEHITSIYYFIIPADSPADVDLKNPLCTALVDELVRRKTYVDPTLIVFRNMIHLCDVDEIAHSPDNDLVPRRLRQFWPKYLTNAGCPQGGSLESRKRVFAKYQELTGLLYRAGVPLLVGTDAPEPHVTPGFSLHTEMELLVESGIPAAAVLSAATLRNATALGQQDHLGSIKAGKLADLVLLRANPLESIRNSRAIDLVVRGGVVSSPADLLNLAPQD